MVLKGEKKEEKKGSLQYRELWFNDIVIYIKYIYMCLSVGIWGEKSRLMKTNKAETALYRAPTFSLLLASHGGLVHIQVHNSMNI